MSATLRNTITELAASFAASVLEALRGASLEEILAESGNGAGRRGPGRPRTSTGLSFGLDRRGGRAKSERLGRRSADDISALVDRIVDLLAKSPEGLRAEQIRESLDLEAKELPRPLAEALSSRRIGKSGQKRATTYYVRGAGAKGAGAKARGAGKKGKVAGKAPRKGVKGRKGAEQGADSASADA